MLAKLPRALVLIFVSSSMWTGGVPARAQEAPESEPVTESEPPSEADPALEVEAETTETETELESEIESDDDWESESDVESDLDDNVPTFGARATVSAVVPNAQPDSPSDATYETAPFRGIPRRTAEDHLTRAPGVFLLNHNGEGHASTFIVRGFLAGEGQDLEMLVDGMPINEPSNAHGHGYADSLFLIPELIRSVRVTEGPFAAWQGDFAVAGSAEYTLGPEERGIFVQGTYGSFDRTRLVLGWAPVRATPGTFVAIDLRRTNGFGIQRAAESAVFNGRFELELSRGLVFSLFAAGQIGNFASAGVVREDEVSRNELPCPASPDGQFFCTRDPNQGGATQRLIVTAGLDWTAADVTFRNRLWVGIRHLRIRQNWTGLRIDPQGDGLDEQYDTVTVGLRGRARIASRLAQMPLELELGYILRHDMGTTRMLRVRLEGGIPYRAVFDDEIALTNIGGHVGGDLHITDWLLLRLGVRADAFGLHARELAFPTSDRVGERLPQDTTNAWGLAIAPRGSVSFKLAPWLHWQTSIGMGTRSSDATALSTGENAPFARIIASETGLLASADENHIEIEGRLSAFQTYVDRDLVFDAERGRNVDIGASSRLGAMAAIQLHVEEWFHAAGSFVWNEGFVLPTRNFDLTSNVTLPYAPRWVGRLDVSGSFWVAIDDEAVFCSLGVGFSALGERPLPIGDSAPPIGLLDAQLTFAWRGIDVALAATNLLDTRWQSGVFRYTSAWDPNTPASRVPALHFAAGAPLTITLSVGFRFDETELGGVSESTSTVAPSNN